MKDAESKSKRALRSIPKIIGFGIVISLSLLGIFFIALVIYITYFDSLGSHSKQNDAIWQLNKIDNALEEYKLDITTYPSSLSELIEDDESKSMWMGPYLKSKGHIDPWGHIYHYQYFPERKGYQLYTLGSDHAVGGDDQAKDRISAKSLMLIKPNKLYEDSIKNDDKNQK
ncbi:type II secretion system protein G [Marinicella pacifica]|uniref:Type II secretion system protein G n=1 Tax=Marinicella pacifica TaxID=1171543 RepID=A0A917CQ13_9GAMM|nr:type II secretion system protein GspG [Marinicella pacifica]GGF93334.1 type II secretion system protein G [Marinicella pacifica]